MQLSLTTWQRVRCAMTIGAVQGDIRAFRTGCNLLDILELSAADQALVGFRAQPNGNLTWQDVGHRWELEVAGDELEMLRRHVRSTEWSMLDRVHRAEIEDLLEQLGV